MPAAGEAKRLKGETAPQKEEAATGKEEEEKDAVQLVGEALNFHKPGEFSPFC